MGRLNISTGWLTGKLGRAAVRLLQRKDNSVLSVARLQAFERLLPTLPVEKELLRLRHLSFHERSPGLTACARNPLAPSEATSKPSGQLRTTKVEDLSLDRIAQDINSQGCVWVKGLLPAQRAEYLRKAIDRTLADKQTYDKSNAPTQWYAPFSDLPDKEQKKELNKQRIAMGNYPTSIFAADSPKNFSTWIEFIRRTGLTELITQYIGERPALSLSKTVLRRQPPMEKCGGWHQDGAFLGANVKTLNVWLALTDCGENAPGLDILPRRIGLMPTGTDGAHFKWSISDDLVQQTYPGEIVRPKFEVGDALIFDQFFLHRTASSAEMMNDRYAIESWFFSPEAFPERYSGFLV
jgi:hypothetical protein